MKRSIETNSQWQSIYAGIGGIAIGLAIAFAAITVATNDWWMFVIAIILMGAGTFALLVADSFRKDVVKNAKTSD